MGIATVLNSKPTFVSFSSVPSCVNSNCLLTYIIKVPSNDYALGSFSTESLTIQMDGFVRVENWSKLIGKFAVTICKIMKEKITLLI